MTKNEMLTNRLKNMNVGVKGNAGKVIENITQQEEEVDFSKITEELEGMKTTQSRNDGHTKDTIYIEDDIYKALMSLCVQRGDKKRHVNQALKEYIIRQYKELNKK